MRPATGVEGSSATQSTRSGARVILVSSADPSNTNSYLLGYVHFQYISALQTVSSAVVPCSAEHGDVAFIPSYFLFTSFI